jgi:pentatricopeptide repeat protein
LHRGGCLDAALFLLRLMSHESRLAVSYTTLMRALCGERRAGQAVGLLRSMEVRGVHANVVTYGTLIRGLCDAAEVDKVVELLNEMRESGIETNVVVSSCLLQGYYKAGS